MSLNSRNPEPPDEAFCCDKCGHTEGVPQEYLQELVARHREWYMQQVNMGDNFKRPGRRLLFKGQRDPVTGRTVASVEKSSGGEG